MKRMIAWFATNQVAANLVMGFSVLAGTLDSRHGDGLRTDELG